MTADLIKGQVYEAGLRGYKSQTPSLYVGKKRFYSYAPERHIIYQRDGNSVKVLTFTKSSLKSNKLTIKHVREIRLSKLEAEFVSQRLRQAGL